VSDFIVSIAPRLPPSICGVGDASWLLSQHWPSVKDQFSYIVVDGACQSRSVLKLSRIYQVHNSAIRLFNCLKRIRHQGIILHYAGRGFHRYGVPLWLLWAILAWRKTNPSAKLILFVHEVSSLLPLRSHHGIISRLDRYIIRSLSLSADVVLTNTIQHRHQIQSLTGLSSVYLLPVFPNLFELSNPPDWTLRKQDVFLIFGQPSTQLQILHQYRTYLQLWLSCGLLESLHIVGPQTNEVTLLAKTIFLDRCNGLNCLQLHGVLEPADISKLLIKAGYCLSCASVDTYSKSGSFMAFASRACPVVCFAPSEQPPIVNTITPAQVKQDLYFEACLKGLALYHWQRKHASQSSVAETFHSLWRNVVRS